MKSTRELLQSAIIGGKVAEVESLLENKADVNAKNPKNGYTPLMYGVHYSRVEIVKLICEKKPDKRLQDHRGKTVFDHCDWLTKRYPAVGKSIASILDSKTNESQHLLATITELEKQLQKAKEEKINSKFLESKNENSQKSKAFRRLIEAGVTESFYISKAIEESKVSRAHDSLDTMIDVVKKASPTVQSELNLKGISMVLDIAGTFIQIIRDKRVKVQAFLIVEAFQNNSKGVDTDKLEGISKFLAERYTDQIEYLTVSLTTKKTGEIIADPRSSDGIFVLARAIVNRIVAAIMQDKHKFYPQSWSFLSTKERLQIPISKRCVYAILDESLDKDNQLNNGKGEEKDQQWTVYGVLNQTGIKIKEKNSKVSLYTYDSLRSQTAHKKYGFCWSDADEVKERDFKHDPETIDIFTSKPAASSVGLLASPPAMFAAPSLIPTSSSQSLEKPLLDGGKQQPTSSVCCTIL